MTARRLPVPGPRAPGLRRRLPGVLVSLTALAAGLLFATSATTAGGTDLRAGRRLQLGELIAQRRAEVGRQERAAQQLRAEVSTLTAAAAARDGRTAQETARGDALAPLAGTVPVTGNGLTVSLDDAPPDTQGGSPDDLVVHQQDVQAVVNALWAGGAEAMQLMDQRVVSTSAVRCVGNTLVLQGQVYGPPFVVTAIGDPEALRSALDAEPGVELFRRYVDRFGLGYEVRPVQGVLLPAYTGSLDLPTVTR